MLNMFKPSTTHAGLLYGDRPVGIRGNMIIELGVAERHLLLRK